MREIPESIDHPAAWRGQQLLSREDWLQTLSPTWIQEIQTALELTRNLPDDAISKERFPLPTFGQALSRIQISLENGSGATLLRGLDPSTYANDDRRRLFLGILSHVGTPISQSADGDLVFSVRDEGFGESDPRTRGPNTSKKLSFHTDRCDVIGFLCLNQALEGGENEIVSSIAVYNEIRARRPDLLQHLLEPFYYKRHNVDGGNSLPWCRQPIFSFHEGHFASAFLRVLIERAYALPEIADMTALQREALDFVEAVAAEPEMHVRFRQEPGDILLLNNWVTYHRRSAFVDHEDPALKRHILRIWLSTPNSRPLAPWFKDNYGATEAGAIRGGMRKSQAT
ncbi:MAG: alpha-ketoglutarate-dependent taurine dioxygenase [Verrucomicrobiales bacterium]|jgi:alpha-ketoglutarate-dependent taurine dioxygenase